MNALNLYFLSDQQGDVTLALAENTPKLTRGILGFLLIVLAYFTVAILYVFVCAMFIAAEQPEVANGAEQMQRIVTEHIGSVSGISGMYMMQFLILMPLVLHLAHFKTQSLQATLAIKPVPIRSLGYWLGVLLVFMAAEVLIDTFVHIPVDDFLALLSGSGHLGIAFVAIILAPILEELVFRGYLFKTLRHSWLGFSGTLLITSLLFTLIHVGQYNAIIMWELFAFSLILGVAREKTGSVIVPWFLHMLNNLVQIVLVVFVGIV